LLWMVAAGCSRLTPFLSYDGGRGRTKSKTNKPGQVRDLIVKQALSVLDK